MGIIHQPANHTSAVAHNTNTAYRESLGFWHGIRNQLKNNKVIELTDFDYQALDIHIDKTTRTPSKPSVYAPENSVVRCDHLVVQISFYQPAMPKENYCRNSGHCRENGNPGKHGGGQSPLFL